MIIGHDLGAARDRASRMMVCFNPINGELRTLPLIIHMDALYAAY